MKKKSNVVNYVKNILVFGIISLPIGLWYQVRNLIKFSNINIPEPGDFLYNGEYSIVDRFFSLNFNELFSFPNTYIDYNLPSFIIKSSVWGEYDFTHIKVLSYVVLILNILLIIISLLFTFKYLLNKRKNDTINILNITWIISLIMMYLFNYKYPFGCSMDFRYISICLISGIIIISYGLSNFKLNRINKIIEVLCYLFVIFSLGLVILI